MDTSGAASAAAQRALALLDAERAPALLAAERAPVAAERAWVDA
jgi:hypothetical protein